MATSFPTCHPNGHHRWGRIGGCQENPGFVGIGGSAIRETQRCSRCGMTRRRVFGDVNACGNRNHGWRYTDSAGDPMEA